MTKIAAFLFFKFTLGTEIQMYINQEILLQVLSLSSVLLFLTLKQQLYVTVNNYFYATVWAVSVLDNIWSLGVLTTTSGMSSAYRFFSTVSAMESRSLPISWSS